MHLSNGLEEEKEFLVVLLRFVVHDKLKEATLGKDEFNFWNIFVLKWSKFICLHKLNTFPLLLSS